MIKTLLYSILAALFALQSTILNAEDCIGHSEFRHLLGKIERNEIVDASSMHLLPLAYIRYLFHMEQAKSSFDEANEACLLIKDEEMRTQALDIFQRFWKDSCKHKTYSNVVYRLAHSLQKYNIDQTDEWEDIQILLIDADFHFLLAEKYHNFLVLNKYEDDHSLIDFTK